LGTFSIPCKTKLTKEEARLKYPFLESIPDDVIHIYDRDENYSYILALRKNWTFYINEGSINYRLEKIKTVKNEPEITKIDQKIDQNSITELTN